MEVIIDARMKEKFASYPSAVRKKLQHLRQLIIETAEETPAIDTLEETLKWGEPSYISNIGSTIRIDWKAKTPDQYAIYFKCTSTLVATFRMVYASDFNYEKNRAILFSMKDIIPKEKLKSCIAAALQYHKVKQLELLGIVPVK